MSEDKCDICHQPGAGNYYGIAILEGRTEVTTARWGAWGEAARKRAAEAARAFARPGEFVYDIKVVFAHSRHEVVRAYCTEP